MVVSRGDGIGSRLAGPAGKLRPARGIGDDGANGRLDVVAGGGRHNPVMLRMISDRIGLDPEPVDALGWNGDAIEAEGFAYMAVRNLKGLPISFPGTTGVPGPMTGGVLHQPQSRAEP